MIAFKSKFTFYIICLLTVLLMSCIDFSDEKNQGKQEKDSITKPQLDNDENSSKKIREKPLDSLKSHMAILR